MTPGCSGLRRQRLCRAAFAAVALAVAWLALSPSPPPSVDTGWDKLNHVLAFATLTFIVQGMTRRPGVPRMATVSVGVLYGVAIEIAQAWVPGRSSDWQDLLANGVGIAAGCALAWAVWRRTSGVPAG